MYIAKFHEGRSAKAQGSIHAMVINNNNNNNKFINIYFTIKLLRSPLKICAEASYSVSACNTFAVINFLNDLIRIQDTLPVYSLKTMGVPTLQFLPPSRDTHCILFYFLSSELCPCEGCTRRVGAEQGSFRPHCQWSGQKALQTAKGLLQHQTQ